MKIATWNVNGIRARDAQLQEFIEREQPDVLCLQELKASLEQLPVWLCQLEGYWCYWHGGKGYSGVGLHVRKDTCPAAPDFQHPQFDYEHRIVTVELPAFTIASIYVPNGGKDFPAKMRFLEALELFAAEYEASARPWCSCGDFNVARTDMDVHPKERKPNGIGQRPDERALLERIIGHGLVDVHRKMEPENAEHFHVVGAVEKHAAAQHRLAPRHGPGEHGARRHEQCHASSIGSSARAIMVRLWPCSGLR